MPPQVTRSDDRRLTAPPPGVTAVAGGASRSASVRRGLQAVPDTAQVVLAAERTTLDEAVELVIVKLGEAEAVA